jgi:phosphatidylcholine synthase
MSTLVKNLYSWFVHIFTASGAVLGLLSLDAIAQHEYKRAFILMAITIVIDAVDGTLARQVDIKKYVKIDGSLLDNMIDFFNYVLVPAFFVSWSGIIPQPWIIPCLIAIVFAACYQFAQLDAKTDDHFFKGFPSYWNIAVFYLYYWQTGPATNVVLIFALSFLSFVPIKYIYPSRMQHVSKSHLVRTLMFAASIVWAIATVMLIFTYPQKQPILNSISIAYLLLYFFFSLYLTFRPVK